VIDAAMRRKISVFQWLEDVIQEKSSKSGQDTI
jgi:hypothetical protein